MFGTIPGMFNADTQTLVVNVRSYGAMGNGINDDTAAIQRAINSLPAVGGVVYIPAGNYIISSALILDTNNITLMGQSQRNTSPPNGATVLQMASTADPTWALIVGNTANVFNCLLHGFAIQGRNSASTTGGGILFRCGGGKIFQVKVAQFGGTGINVTSFGATLFEIFFDDVNLVSCGMNSGSPGDNLVLAGTISDCEFNRCTSSGNAAKNTTRHGVNNGASECKFVQYHCYYCSGDGFNQVSGQNTQIFGGEWENNTGNGIRLNGTANTVMGADLFGNGNADIEMDSGDHCVIVGNKMSSSGGSPNLACFGVNTSTLADNTIRGQATSILLDSVCTKNTIHDNVCDGATNGISCAGTFCSIHNNEITTGNLIEATGANNNNIHDNTIVTGGKTITIIGASTHVKNNPGFNPVGSVTTPGFPASTVAVVNTTGVDVTAFVANSTSAITQIQIAGAGGSYVSTNMNIAASTWAAIRLPVGAGIKFTYAGGAPTWTWFGD